MKNTRRNKPVHFSFTESDGLLAGDSIGNRQRHSETRICADDIGNRRGNIEGQAFVRDDIGNSIAMAPTHLESGILFGVEGKNRRRRESSLEAKHAYSIGGVNPIISGNQALLKMFSSEHGEPEMIKSADSVPDVKIKPSEGSGVLRSTRQSERIDGSDRWLKRLLDLDDDDRLEPAINADPKKKSIEARGVVSEIFTKGEVMTAIGTEIVAVGDEGRSQVLVSFEDIEGMGGKSQLEAVFSTGSLPLMALNFLVNKIVNKDPNERVKVAIAPRVRIGK